jgi:hypothetical protein
MNGLAGLVFEQVPALTQALTVASCPNCLRRTAEGELRFTFRQGELSPVTHFWSSSHCSLRAVSPAKRRRDAQRRCVYSSRLLRNIHVDITI